MEKLKRKTGHGQLVFFLNCDEKSDIYQNAVKIIEALVKNAQKHETEAILKYIDKNENEKVLSISGQKV